MPRLARMGEAEVARLQDFLDEAHALRDNGIESA
jgi:hypothetical protein